MRPRLIERQTPMEAYREALTALAKFGEPVVTRGKRMKELLNVSMLSHEPGFVDAESVDLPYIFREVSNILGRRNCDLDHPEWVSKNLNPGADRPNLFWGDEVRSAINWDNLRRVISYLVDTPNTRRAVLGFTINEMFTEPEVRVEIDDLSTGTRYGYYIPDYVEDPSEVPCLVFGHFIRRSERLHFQVQTRSADIDLGVPYDYYLFQTIHLLVAAYTSNRVGDFIYRAVSLHKYIGDVDEEA